MALRYYRLFNLLNRQQKKKTDLLEILSSKTIAKLSKGEYVSGEVIDKICGFLDCQPGDIMEYCEIIEDARGSGQKFEVINHHYELEREHKAMTEVADIYPLSDNPQGEVLLINKNKTCVFGANFEKKK